jgi:peptidyl-dipeptidase A
VEIAAATGDERQSALAGFIARLVAELEPLHLRHNEAVWQANVTGDPVHEEESARLDAQIRTVFSRPDAYEFLRDTAAAGALPDPLFQRQLLVLLNAHRANQIAPARIEQMVQLEKKLESRFNNFRATLDGQRVGDNRIREILVGSDDVAERRRAWEASKQIGGEVVEDLLALVRLRNEAAREIGFDNYYTMMLTLDELDETELFTLLDLLDAGTRPLFDTYRAALDARLSTRFGIGREDLRPWHFADPFFQEAPAAEVDLDPWFAGKSLEAIAEHFFHAVGFEITDLLERADLYEKPGKSQHAFCMSVDRGADVRVLCNLRPNEYWMGTLLHEFGHAVYDKYIDRSLPWVLRTHAHILSTEASAMLFGRLSKNAAWLERYAGMTGSAAREAGEARAGAVRAQLLVQTRWMLVMCAMERALYRDPEQDLDTLWWDLVERFQRVQRPEGRSAPDWASKIHFSVAPVYYHNYQLGEIMASQLQRHLTHEVIGGAEPGSRYVSSPAVGAFLREKLYRSGRSLDWRDTLRQATGQALDPAAFVEELAGRGTPGH